MIHQYSIARDQFEILTDESHLCLSARDLAVAALSVEVKLADFSCAGVLTIEESRSRFWTIAR